MQDGFEGSFLPSVARLPEGVARGSGTRGCAGENSLCYNFWIRNKDPEQASGRPTGAAENTMFSPNSKLRLIGAFAALASLALAVSCRGFFVDPIISSLAVGPANPTIETGTTNNTVQMTVSGTNNDGSIADNPSVSWTITPTSVATISNDGLVTSASTGTATITATSNQNPSVSATQSVTVTVGCISAITLDPTSGNVSANSGTTVSITATATTCNGSPNVTSVATWTSSNTSLATVAGGLVTAVPGITTGGIVQITASIGNITSAAATINVSP
jgi:hypothetical protein